MIKMQAIKVYFDISLLVLHFIAVLWLYWRIHETDKVKLPTTMKYYYIINVFLILYFEFYNNVFASYDVIE